MFKILYFVLYNLHSFASDQIKEEGKQKVLFLFLNLLSNVRHKKHLLTFFV